MLTPGITRWREYQRTPSGTFCSITSATLTGIALQVLSSFLLNFPALFLKKSLSLPPCGLPQVADKWQQLTAYIDIFVTLQLSTFM